MCQCTPNIRTPYCGRGDCQWPHSRKEGEKLTNVAHDRKPVESSFLQDANGNPTGGKTTGQGFEIDWQNGVQERNGAFLEEVLEAACQRLEFYQSGKFACRENALALTNIQQAMQWLDWRMKNRTKRGVEGTYEV